MTHGSSTEHAARLLCEMGVNVDVGDSRDERLAKNEVLFRSVNESIEQQALRFGGIDDRFEFICECSSTTCVERIELTLREYEKIRGDGVRFVVMPGHANVEIELVVANDERYHVVEKDGVAGLIAEHNDPRDSESE